MSPGQDDVGDETRDDVSSAFSGINVSILQVGCTICSLTIISLGAVVAVVPTVLTSRPSQRIAVGPLITRSFLFRNSIVRRGSRNDSEEEHTNKHHTESAGGQE